MAYRLVLLDRFLLIIGSGLVLSFIFIIAAVYYVVKLYYFMQMSEDTSKISMIILRIFFWGMFFPIMVLFFANEMAIPLWGSPSAEQMSAYRAGNIQLSLIEHRLNTGMLYIVLMAIIGITYILYHYFDKYWRKREQVQQSPVNPNVQNQQYRY